MKPFTYHEPKTIEEAISCLKEFGKDGKIKAGGTDLMVAMKMEMFSPAHLINLKNLRSLVYMKEVAGGGLKIGALTPLGEIERSTVVRKRFPVLAQAASSVASPHLRNRATLGGNIALDSRCPYFNQYRQWFRGLAPCLKRKGAYCHVTKKEGRCHSLFSADTVPALIALGAKVRLAQSEGERIVPVEDLYTGLGNKINRIRHDEILTEIEIPEMEAGISAVYHKVNDRGQIDFPVIGVAAKVSTNKGHFREVDVVLIGTGPAPVKLAEIGRNLSGKKTELKTVEEACREIPEKLQPISNAYGLAEYKRSILPSQVMHAIIDAVSRAQ